jgi:hypothetical protein
MTMKKPLAFIALCAGAAVAPALAASSTSSAASDSASSATSSASNSLQGSSNSSSTQDVAAGDYTVVEVLALAGQPDRVRLKLQAAADGGGGDASDAFSFYLLLPAPAYERSRLALGDTVVARARPYGLEFSRADTQQAFFLVLDDAWHRELAPRAVVM